MRAAPPPNGRLKNYLDLRPEDVVIDPEFASHIPAPAPDEYASLERQILADGCRDPVIVWPSEGRFILIDGHTRRRICAAHGLRFPAHPQEFADRQAALDFIVARQSGRRNLSPEAANYFLGKRYLAEKQQGKRNDLTSAHNEQKSAAKRLAAEYKVSAAKIRRFAEFAEAVDGIVSNCGPAARQWLLSRDMYLTRRGVNYLSTLSPEEQRKYIEEAVRGEKRPRFPSKGATITLPRKPEDLAPRLLARLGREEAVVVARLLVRGLCPDLRVEEAAPFLFSEPKEKR